LQTNATPTPSTALGRNQRLALALVGTVPLPSPIPATGRVFIGISPYHDDALPTASLRYFLKSVQTVSAKQVITRIFNLVELRAVSLPTATGEEYAYPTRETHLIEGQILDEIKRAQQLLLQAATAQPEVFELLLYEDAVLYVREDAPVLLHQVFEYGATAAECAEAGGALRCCPGEPS
jgi:hypothetical protein